MRLELTSLTWEMRPAAIQAPISDPRTPRHAARAPRTRTEWMRRLDTDAPGRTRSTVARTICTSIRIRTSQIGYWMSPSELKKDIATSASMKFV